MYCIIIALLSGENGVNISNTIVNNILIFQHMQCVYIIFSQGRYYINIVCVIVYWGLAILRYYMVIHFITALHTRFCWENVILLTFNWSCLILRLVIGGELMVKIWHFHTSLSRSAFNKINPDNIYYIAIFWMKVFFFLEHFRSDVGFGDT